MRALAVNEDLIVVVSGMWQTTATAVRSGGEGFLIDSPVLPDELDALPGLLAQAGFAVSGLLCTHADWDHLLGRLAFPAATLGAGETSALRLSQEMGAPQRALREFDGEHYIDGRPPLGLAGVQSLPVPGRLSLGESSELELHPAPGHTVDGTAFWLPWMSVLVCGDYLSPVEIPMISAGGSAEVYTATLERLAPFVSGGATVVPGHGSPLAADDAKRILTEDLAYVEGLAAAGDAKLPPGRRSHRQKQIHAKNLATLGAP